MNRKMSIAAATSLCVVVSGTALHGGDEWVTFDNVTSDRMPLSHNDPETSTADESEKDYAWGDVDQDGDVDLVCVRKQPFTLPGRRTNVLFMNEGTVEGHAMNGVLVDRTAQYASLSDVKGDLGFLTETCDYDVVLCDVNGDGWLDMVTAVGLTDNDEKHLSHPRVYRNLGERDGLWLGFQYEDARFPQMHETAGPRFTSVAAGDIDNDGDIDLWFGDHDSGPSEIFDFNCRLFENDGTGHFSDVTADRMTEDMSWALFSTAVGIADMNGDGAQECVKLTALSSPAEIGIIYNDPDNLGYFNTYQSAYSMAAYYFAIEDLNGDGRMDLVVQDDGIDKLLLNTGNDEQNLAEFQVVTLDDSEGLGGNMLTPDLDNDGFPDLIIADVDIDIPGCGRSTLIYRNTGDVPIVSMDLQTGMIPPAMVTGVFDVAAFDVDGDGWTDLIFGRCDSTEVWLNNRYSTIDFVYPDGRAETIAPDTSNTLRVDLLAVGDFEIMTDGLAVLASIDGSPFAPLNTTHLGEHQFEVEFPALSCLQSVDYYLVGELENGDVVNDPPSGVYSAIAGHLVTLFSDSMESENSHWSVTSVDLQSGNWERTIPIGTTIDGVQMAPAQSSDGQYAFVTENGDEGGTAGASDVDGGPTILTSPTFALDGIDARVNFARWARSTGGDTDNLEVEISNNGGLTWTPMPGQSIGDTNGLWNNTSFIVSDYIIPTDLVQFRFIAQDQPNDSVTEAGIDDVVVKAVVCDPSCNADISGGDFAITVDDLFLLLANWGTDGPGAAIAEPTDVVDVNDLLTMLGLWGPCF